MPHVWWARRETLLAVGGTALAVWMIVGAWMLFAPSNHGGDFAPDQAPTQPAGVQPTQEASTDSGYDPSVYRGPVNTPSFSPHPSPLRTSTNAPSGSGTSPAPTSTTSAPPPPTATTSGPGNGNDNGPGHGHKPGLGPDPPISACCASPSGHAGCVADARQASSLPSRRTPCHRTRLATLATAAIGDLGLGAEALPQRVGDLRDARP
jgi:hypothetical protein